MSGWEGEIAREWYGRHRIVFDGRDVTFFRGIPTRLMDYQLTDPYGHGPATFAFPQISPFEIEDIDWLHKGSLCEIQRVEGDEVTAYRWWGFVTSLSSSAGAITVEAAGELSGRMSLTDRQQPVLRLTMELGELIQRAWRTTNFSFRMDPPVMETGILLDNTVGCNQDNLAFCDYLLNLARFDEGDLTLMPKPGVRRTYEPRIRDVDTIDATIYLGARGISENLSDDVTEQPNRIYGQGISPTGEAWHNRIYPNLGDEVVPSYPGALSLGDTGEAVLVLAYELAGSPYLRRDEISDTYTADIAQAVREVQRDAGLPLTGDIDTATWAAVYGDGAEQQSYSQARSMPLVADPIVVPLLRAANGNVIGVRPEYDRQAVRIDRSIDYGEGVSKARATRAARQLLNRNAGGNWLGTIEMRSDAAAGEHTYGDPITPFSRLDMEAGMNIRLRNFADAGGIKLHVSGVSVAMDGESPSVTLTVDQQGRDPLTIQEIIERNKQSRSDPSRRRRPRRKSAFPASAISGWDSESGAGYMKPRPLAGGWNVFATPGAQEGIIKAIEYRTYDSACRFAIAIFSREIDADTLEARIGNPFAARTDDYTPWTDPDHDDWLHEGERPRLVYAAGGPDQACGYGRGQETNRNGEPTGHPVTGDFKEVGSWPFHANPLLFIGLYATDSCWGRGQAYTQIVEGV